MSATDTLVHAQPGARKRDWRPALAWSIAFAQTVILLQAIAFWIWSGFWFSAEWAIVGSIGFAIVGALIASQRLSHRFGWFLLFATMPGLISFVASEYVDLNGLHHVSLPFVPLAHWIGNWAWTPSFGMAISMITVRFPDGRVPRGWRFVDWVATGGTALLAAAIAWLTFPGGSGVMTPAISVLFYLGLSVVAVGALCSVGSLAWRYKRGNSELRLQMKWILLATMVLTIALSYVGVTEIAFQTRFDYAMAPFFAALICVPLAIGIAILRHRLFDIDLIINRTIVYVSVTAILGGLFFAVVELMQRIVLAATNQRSETTVEASVGLEAQLWPVGEAFVRHKMREVMEAPIALATNEPTAVTVELTDPDYKDTLAAYTMSISNIAVTGAHLPLAPGHDIREPDLWLTIYHEMGPVGMIKTIDDLMHHQPVPAQYVSRHPFKHARITAADPLTVCADGTKIGTLPIEVEAIPHAVRVAFPEEAMPAVVPAAAKVQTAA